MSELISVAQGSPDCGASQHSIATTNHIPLSLFAGTASVRTNAVIAPAKVTNREGLQVSSVLGSTDERTLCDGTEACIGNKRGALLATIRQRCVGRIGGGQKAQEDSKHAIL